MKLDSMDEEVDGIVKQNAEKERQEGEEVMKQEEKAKVFQSTKRTKHSQSIPRFPLLKQTFETEAAALY